MKMDTLNRQAYLILLCCTLSQSLHLHENRDLPKGWGEVQRLRVVSPSSLNAEEQTGSLSLVNAAVVDQRTASAGNNIFESDLGEDGTVFALPAKARPSSYSSSSPPPLPIPLSPPSPVVQEPPVMQFLWRVYNFSKIANDGQLELLFSPRFYLNTDLKSSTSTSASSNSIPNMAYRLQLLLVTNTTYVDNISYLGVFFRIVAGDYDGSLEWPYKYRTVLSILEHDQLASASRTTTGSNTSSEGVLEAPILYSEWNHTVVPNIDECRLRSAFLRPNSDSDTGSNTDGCGNRRHMPLSQLLHPQDGSSTGRFTTAEDDTLLVLITVHLTEADTEASSLHFSQAALSMRYNDLVSNFEWTIEQFSKKEKEATEKGRIAILTSSPFYTHTNGYLLQLFLTVLPKRNAFAISIAFVQGDHDRYLQWPFPYAFEMAIVDQSPDYWKRDLTVKVKPSKSDCGTESFGQPGQQPEFCFLTIQSLQVLSLTHYNFLLNDTLRIRFTTRFNRYSARQRSSIRLVDGRLVSEFNWLIPGLVARFEKYITESYDVPRGASSPTSSASSATRQSHKFVSDEFYTNGQGYLCQLQLTVTVRTVPLNLSNSSSPSNDSSTVNTTSRCSSTPAPEAIELENPKPQPLNQSEPLFKAESVSGSTNPYTEYQQKVLRNSGAVPIYSSRSSKQSSTLTQDVLVFGLELVIIEGEYDRFLEWPFNAAYELAIVGYKSIPGETVSGIGEPTSANADASVGQLYTADTSTPPNNNKNSNDSNGQKRTSSTLVIPSEQVASGQCVKEAFQKPIERNPACGIREFVHLSSTEESRRQRQAKKHESPRSSTDEQSFSSHSGSNSPNTFEVGTLGGKSEEDLHLRVRIYL